VQEPQPMSLTIKATIFYSWQSDTRAAANRTLIKEALEAAAKELRDDGSISVEPVIDRDTLAVPGAPDIGTTILEKIDASAVMVADVTIVGRDNNRPTPNPNVLIELGYALKSLAWRRIILVQNVAFGGPEDLPFDLRQKRVLTYNSPEDATSRAPERRQLQAALKEALALVLAKGDIRPVTAFPVELSMEYQKVKIRSGRHDYQLQVRLTNAGTKPITDWHVDVSMPTRLLESFIIFAARVPERSNAEQTLFRGTQKTHGGVIYPGDTRLALTIDYYVDGALFHDLRGLFDERVTAVAYVHGEIAATAEKVVRDIQIF
jgi:hypothetical protein